MGIKLDFFTPLPGDLYIIHVHRVILGGRGRGVKSNFNCIFKTIMHSIFGKGPDFEMGDPPCTPPHGPLCTNIILHGFI
jgi:hypothetical protein